MKYYKQINGKTIFFNGILNIEGKQVINPTKEQLKAVGWRTYEPPTADPYTPTYEERVEQLIREKYSVSNELAILRQRDTKIDEFNEYFAFCEECKMKVKAILGISEGEAEAEVETEAGAESDALQEEEENN